MDRDCLLISHEAMLAHDVGRAHPERPERLRALLAAFGDAHGRVRSVTGSPAGRKAVERVHTEEYIAFIESLRGETYTIDDDTAVCPSSVDAAFLAVGCALQAVDVALAQTTTVPFALVRPPGHHAESHRTMGFCLFNNVAAGAAHAIAEHDVGRVVIIDWDVHHGNGTQEIFYDRSDVVFLSVHQSPCYPGTGSLQEVGSGEGTGCTINIPLPPGCGDGVYGHVFKSIIEPIARSAQPELILVSAGFDAHRRDPLALMNMSDAGFGLMMRSVLDAADAVCDGRVALILEGGYDLDGLVSGVNACIDVTTGSARGEEVSKHAVGSVHRAHVDTIREHHAAHWPILAR